MPLKLRLVALLLALLVTACQATSKYAGSGALQLSPSAADTFESYLEIRHQKVIAISTDGTFTFTNYCPFHRCEYPVGMNIESDAIEKCEHDAKKCQILAVNNEFVWNGAIYPPNVPSKQHKALFTRKQGQFLLTNVGEVSLVGDGARGTLNITTPEAACHGQFDSLNRNWSLECGRVVYRGELTQLDDGGFWGQAPNSVELLIYESDWPLLREALTKHNAKPPSTAIEPQGRRASLNWTHIRENYEGVIDYLPSAPKGTLSFRNNATGVECRGELLVFYGTSGTWDLQCSDGQTASGSLRFPNGGIFGRGRSKNDAYITFNTID